MNNSSIKKAERELKELTKKTQRLEQQLEIEKKKLYQENQKNKSLIGKLSRRDVAASSLKEEVLALKKTSVPTYRAAFHRAT